MNYCRRCRVPRELSVPCDSGRGVGGWVELHGSFRWKCKRAAVIPVCIVVVYSRRGWSQHRLSRIELERPLLSASIEVNGQVLPDRCAPVLFLVARPGCGAHVAIDLTIPCRGRSPLCGVATSRNGALPTLRVQCAFVIVGVCQNGGLAQVGGHKFHCNASVQPDSFATPPKHIVKIH